MTLSEHTGDKKELLWRKPEGNRVVALSIWNGAGSCGSRPSYTFLNPCGNEPGSLVCWRVQGGQISAQSETLETAKHLFENRGHIAQLTSGRRHPLPRSTSEGIRVLFESQLSSEQ